MKQQIIRSGDCLTKEEKGLSQEERNAICCEELYNFGFIRDFRLSDAETTPKQETIALNYKGGTITFTSLPSECPSLYCFFQGTKAKIFSSDYSFGDMAFKDYHKITIDQPELGKEYNLYSLEGNPSADYLRGIGKLFFANSTISPHSFEKVEGSVINVVILKGGNIRIDLINFDCDSLTFRSSSLFENAFDLFVDSGMQEGDISIANVKSGMIVHHPTLALALKHQAALYPLNEGFIAECRFIACPGHSGWFGDAAKFRDASSFSENRDLFCTFVLP